MWRNSPEEERETIREKQAKKHSISVEGVKTVERFLMASSRQGKATPWQATMEFVGEKYDVGAGTVEKIWQAYRNAPPKEKRKRRKIPTTPTAERTP